MEQTAFHSYVTARQLAGFVGDENLLPAFASSSIGVYPYQIAAAQFALRSPYLKGCILCDEGSLGKTYEALLIAAQKWYEGKDRILLILPPNLVGQWIDKIENAFTLPYYLWDSGDELPEGGGLAIATYDFAVRHAEVISSKPWDLIVFDEADSLSKPQNKTVSALKMATEGSFKLLLTPTPITMSIMDIYGLIHFIDETVLPDADEFYKRYFRKPENYLELTSWVSQFAFRTLKSQVTEYVNFTRRVPLTASYELTPQEKSLYEKVQTYLTLSKKVAYPQMDNYDLTLLFFHTLSSSPQAFCKMLENPINRLEECDERTQLEEISSLSAEIAINGKITELLTILKKCMPKLKQLKLPQKAVVFIDNLTTLGMLSELLTGQGYNVICYHKLDAMKRFRTEKSAILLATDTAAKGLDMEFCPVVVNYDLLYNAVEMEQRISRCHRQGQTSDVLVINLLSKENLADVRILELINKRVLQFDGIFGMSDVIVGGFDSPIEAVLAALRKPDEVAADFAENLTAHENENKQLVAHTEDTLFTTFTKAVADKVTITPQYIESKIAALNEKLWEITRFFFSQRDDYEIDEQSQTITLKADEPPRLFYYWTGGQNRPYTGLKRYGISHDFKPNSGRISLTSVLARGIFDEIACADTGTITVDAELEPCEIGFYRVGLLMNRAEIAAFEVLVGLAESGEIMTDEQCRKILELPIISCTESEKVTAYWLRNSTGNQSPHSLDCLVPTGDLIQKRMGKTNSAVMEEIDRIKLRAARKKAALEHSLDDIRTQIKGTKQQLSAESGDRLKELTIGKRLKLLEKELRVKEQTLFFDQIRVDVAAEEEIAAITAKEKYDARVKRQFIIKVLGGNHNER